MKKLKIFLILAVLFISISAVSAEGNFTSLEDAIDNSKDSIVLNQNYSYDATEEEYSDGIEIDKDNFVVNGNGYTIDGGYQTRIFKITGNNVTLMNLKLINGNSTTGGAVYAQNQTTFINVTFFDNTAENGAAIYCTNATINGSTFTQNNGDNGVIYADDGDLYVENSLFTNENNITFSIIHANSNGNLTIENCAFSNSQAKYATAIYSRKATKINGSAFANLTANLTAGAVALKGSQEMVINNSVFINTSAGNNGGAIFADFSAKGVELNNVTIMNATADYGGAICHLGGYLTIDFCKIYENTAKYDGGGVYVSTAFFELINTVVYGNDIISGNHSNGGGVYLDNPTGVHIQNNRFENNTKHGIYAYDAQLKINDTEFTNNGEAIHAVFSTVNMTNITLVNNTYDLNDTDYIFSIEESGVEIELINNTITVKNLPIRFDSRDWGWVTPVKNQGDMGSCWTFGTIGALESALLKATGIEYDFSENNMQNSMLRYSKYGVNNAEEGGENEQGIAYLTSWFGAFSAEYDVYDELGKISPTISTGNETVHVQDVLFIPAREKITETAAIKKAVMEYGAVAIKYHAYQDAPYYNNETAANYQNVNSSANHLICIVGWDDTYSAKNFLTTPPGDGAFIIKNSWGDDSGDKGYYYLSYYDNSILNKTYGFAFIINNTEIYDKNYQTDLCGDISFISYATGFKNTYTATGYDSISAVGSYFKENENYTIEIYVNDELKHTQNGTAPFYGFHTVKLTEEIAVQPDDNFTAVMKKGTCYIMENARTHYLENMTFVEIDGEWKDTFSDNFTVSLKVYTKNLSIYTQDLVKIYKNESQFSAFIGKANETVIFEINGNNYTRTSNENGTAKMNINLRPGDYEIKTTYDNASVENTIKVLPTLIAENLVKYFRNESQFYISLIDGEGDFVPNATITMNINGVFYNRTTNEDGTARLNINLNPGVYILTATDPLTGLEMSYNITVLPVLSAEDIEMTYMDGTQFAATLVDGTGKALAGVDITFNINGVFYNRTTDENGTAHLNIRLMAGEYIITSQYGQAAISNKITITAKED